MASAAGNNPLDALKPIVLPEHGASLWPLAIGWWFLLGCILFLLVLFIFLRPLLKKRKHRKAIAQNALQLLNEYYAECAAQTDSAIATQLYLQKSNDVFKRLVHQNNELSAYANLTGSSWVEFVSLMDDSKTYANLYGDNLYAARCNKDIKLSALHEWACQAVSSFDKNPRILARGATK